MNEAMNYYLEINGKPKCEFDYPDGWVPLLVTCSYKSIEEADIAKLQVENLLPKAVIRIVEGICPAYQEYLGK